MFEVLQKFGVPASITEEGEIGGLAADLGFAPDTGWIDRVKDREGEVVVADPDLYAALVRDGLAGRIKFITEVLLAHLPPGPNSRTRSRSTTRARSRGRAVCGG